MIDIHSHFLPLVDDGPKTLAGSMAILKALAEQGVTDVIATPHFVPETNYVSSRIQNLRVLAVVRDKMKEEKIRINVYLGNELYIDRKIAMLVKTRMISSLADSQYLLVELPLDGEYPNYKDIFMDLLDAGYKVILAHPERYTTFQKDFGLIEEMQRVGLLFQCNIASIIGKYGKRAKKTVRKMIKKKMVFTFGSDIHHAGKSDYILLSQKKLSKYYNRNELKELLVTNPGKIIGR